MTYKIKPDSTNVVVTDVLDIRQASYNADGSYSLPEGLTNRNGTIRQLGLSPREDKALIYIQPPSGIWMPNSGYGPITRKVIVKKSLKELRGDYDRFPSLPRTGEIYELELTEDGMPYVERETFDILNAYDGPILPEDDKFCGAMANVFSNAGFDARRGRSYMLEKLCRNAQGKSAGALLCIHDNASN